MKKGLQFPVRAKIFPFPTTHRLALETLSVSGSLSLEVKQWEHSSSAEVRNMWIYLHAQCAFMRLFGTGTTFLLFPFFFAQIAFHLLESWVTDFERQAVLE